METALCPHSDCTAVSHLECLASDFLGQAEGSSHTSIIPRGGECRSCHTYVLWGDVIRGCYRRHVTPETEIEDAESDTLTRKRTKRSAKTTRPKKTLLAHDSDSDGGELFDIDVSSTEEGEFDILDGPSDTELAPKRHKTNKTAKIARASPVKQAVNSSIKDLPKGATPVCSMSRKLRSPHVSRRLASESGGGSSHATIQIVDVGTAIKGLEHLPSTPSHRETRMHPAVVRNDSVFSQDFEDNSSQSPPAGNYVALDSPKTFKATGSIPTVSPSTPPDSVCGSETGPSLTVQCRASSTPDVIELSD